MMGGLCRKEMRSLLPFAMLLLALITLDVASELVMSAPQLRPLSDTFNEYVHVEAANSPFVLLLALALSSGLLVREFDDGTIEFLATLPVSRSRVFAVKVAAAMGLYSAYTVLGLGLAVTLHSLSRESLNPSFHTRLLTTALVLRISQFFVMLSFGLVLSFLRRFGWLLMGLLVGSYLLLAAHWPAVEILNPFSLAEAPQNVSGWPLPIKQLAAQLPLACVALAVASQLFAGAGGRLLSGLQGMVRTRWGHLVLLLTSCLIVVVSGSLFYFAVARFADEDEPDFGEFAKFRDWTTSRATTRHYEFLYPSNLTDGVTRLVRRADDDYETVAKFFRAEPVGGPVVVDMTDSMFIRHAGRAYWKKIQLNPALELDLRDIAATLGHETSHVLIERLSDSRMSEDFDTTRFFHEGVATFVECQWFLPAAARDEKRLVAAVLRARGLVEFEQLIDNQRLCAKLDGNVVYPLGEAFTAALVKKFGDEAVGKICRAWGQSDAPRDLAGIRKWYDTFQRCGYDLDAAIDAFYGLLDEEVALRRQLIESLEQPRGEADVVEGRVHVVATWKPLEGWNIVCRFRPTEDSLELHFTEGERDETGFSGPHVITFPSSRAWYQLGIQSDRGTVIYQPWTPFDLSQTR